MLSTLVRCLPILAAMLMATGCASVVVSLHPLYREQDLVSAPDLTGEWRQMNDRRQGPRPFPVSGGKRMTRERRGPCSSPVGPCTG